jgi:succinate dehydrogenase / fumarate reductase membrane anchor subunit
VTDPNPPADGPPLLPDAPPTLAVDEPADLAGDGAGAAAPDALEERPWSWHLMQATAWVLLVLLPIQLLTVFVLHDPGHYGVGLYIDRWRHAGWRVFDWVVIVLALVHGGLGVRDRVVARLRSPFARDATTVALAVALALLLIAFSAAVLSFDTT